MPDKYWLPLSGTLWMKLPDGSWTALMEPAIEEVESLDDAVSTSYPQDINPLIPKDFEFSATCKFPMGWRKTQLVMLGISSKNDIRYVYRHAEKWRRYYKKKGITHVDNKMLFNTAVLDLLWRTMENHNERGKEDG